MKIDPHPTLEPLGDRESYYAAYRQAMARRYKEFDALAMEALFNLIQTFSCGEARMSSHIQSHGLTLPGLNILSILRQESPQGCPLNRLSDLLLVSRANITGIVDGLVRKGFVRREEDKNDRRITRAYLTPAGERWLHQYLPGHYERVGELLSGLTRHEKQELIRLLAKLRMSSCQHPRKGEL